MKIHKHINLWVLTSFVIIYGCSKVDSRVDVPLCIEQQIEAISKQPVRNPPGSMWQYTYKGQTTYYIPSFCCDYYSTLLDDKCNTLCAPDGGATGEGDGKCPDFFSTRTNEKLIWQDDRK